MLVEDITYLTLVLLWLIVLANVVGIVLTMTRRLWRALLFRRIDALRKRYGPAIAAVFRQEADCIQGLERLKASPKRHRNALERLLIETKPARGGLPILRRLCEDLGFVAAWQQRVVQKIGGPRAGFSWTCNLPPRGPLSFLKRARAADNLGLIRHRESWPLLVKALYDPHGDVQLAALRALAAIQEPRSFPHVVEKLHQVVLSSSAMLSLRSIKEALVSFPSNRASDLLESLEHPDPRLRFAATDIVLEILERQSAASRDWESRAPARLGELQETLTRLSFDPHADVRARAASAIAHFRNSRAENALLRLLDDPEWFVRLRAVRAISRRRFLPRAVCLRKRLTDTHWMVREAAAEALLALGSPGISRLTQHLVASHDHYSQEQVADVLERAGFPVAWLATGHDRSLSEPWSRSAEPSPDSEVLPWPESVVAPALGPRVSKNARPLHSSSRPEEVAAGGR